MTSQFNSFGGRIKLSLSLIAFSFVIFGVRLVNEFNLNHLLIIGLVIIGVSSYLVHIESDDIIIVSCIFILSLSLLYHRTLISNYIIGADVHVEYYWTQKAIQNTALPESTDHPYASILSVQILYPIIVKVADINLTDFFKITYPLLFSVVPVSTYIIYRRFWTKETAFFAVLIFMFNFLYFKKMAGLVRNGIAEILFVLLILAFLKSRDSRFAYLAVILSVGVVVTHYAVSYFLILLFGIGLTTIILMGGLNFGKINGRLAYPPLVFILISVVYYTIIHTSGVSKIYGLFLNTLGSFGIISMSDGGSIHWATVDLPSVYHQIMRYLFYASQAGIIIGYLKLSIDKLSSTWMTRRLEDADIDLYHVLSGGIFVLIFASVTFPALFGKGSFGFPRVYQISLLIISPYAIIGFKKITGIIASIADIPSYKTTISTFLLIFLLFNSNVVFEVAGVYSNSPSISQDVLDGDENIRNQIMVSSVLLTEHDVHSAKWLKSHNQNGKVYSDFWAMHGVLTSYGGLRYDDSINTRVATLSGLDNRMNRVSVNDIRTGYVYLRSFNTRTNLMIDYLTTWELKKLKVEQRHKIYTNDKSPVYYSQ
ncbi:DUF2206 domain-containing protein [Haloferax sp. YSMS24]|uniref:DUF2206 domain-containing protein n=1 Tax=Haloferax sp. YSMS24 TaxID=3388425 RepID=UPI00398C9EBC